MGPLESPKIRLWSDMVPLNNRKIRGFIDLLRKVGMKRDHDGVTSYLNMSSYQF